MTLLFPFIRMTSGPMDYEPGILDNATTENISDPIGEKVMSMGTRMHQAAMFVVYESPIQIFSGNPSQGLLEPEFMELLAVSQPFGMKRMFSTEKLENI